MSLNRKCTVHSSSSFDQQLHTVSHGNIFEKTRLASDRKTAIFVLRKLATDEAPAVLASLAQNPRTPQEVLPAIVAEALGGGIGWWMVWAAIAGRPSTDSDTLLALFRKNEWCVTLAIIQHHDCPETVLKDVAALPQNLHGFDRKDLNKEIRVIAKRRLGMPLGEEDY